MRVKCSVGWMRGEGGVQGMVRGWHIDVHGKSVASLGIV